MKEINDIFDCIAKFDKTASLEIKGRYFETIQRDVERLKMADKLNQQPEEYEPYFGWCDVEGCKNEGSSGGSCWRETGYWTICYKHASEYRAGKPQPKMKQSAIDREKKRGSDGVLKD